MYSVSMKCIVYIVQISISLISIIMISMGIFSDYPFIFFQIFNHVFFYNIIIHTLEAFIYNITQPSKTKVQCKLINKIYLNTQYT